MSGSVNNVGSGNGYNPSQMGSDSSAFQDQIQQDQNQQMQNAADNNVQSHQHPITFSSLDDFNNSVSGPNASNYTHTSTGGGADKGGTDTYKSIDGDATYNVTRLSDGHTNVEAEVNQGTAQVIKNTVYGDNAKPVDTAALASQHAVPANSPSPDQAAAILSASSGG